MSVFPYLAGATITSTRFASPIDLEFGPVSGGSFRNLILTGRNGAGKTSALAAIQNELHWFATQSMSTKTQLNKLERQLMQFKTMQAQASAEPDRHAYERQIESIETQILSLKRTPVANLSLTGQDEHMQIVLRNNRILQCYLGAKRTAQVNPVKGPSKDLDLVAKNHQNPMAAHFLQFLVNKRTMQAYAREDKDNNTADQIGSWFDHLVGIFREIFSDPKLEFRFKRESFTFEFILGDGRVIDLNELSDGYSGALAILAEMMIRSDYLKRTHPDYNGEGIVLIDEVETHLHLELQRALMPLLQHLYPKIQFIVATHSPAVIASMKNSVVYDLSRGIRIDEPLGAAPMGVLAKDVFGLSSEYSLDVTLKLSKVQDLLALRNRTPAENETLNILAAELERMSVAVAAEVQLALARQQRR